MNYKKHYDLLIKKASERDLFGYYEIHHIVPKCMGGNDDSCNLIKLTAREHYIAHILLAKIYGGSLWHAVNLMGRLKKYTNRYYEKARIEHSLLLSEQNRKTKSKSKEQRLYLCSECNNILVYTEFSHHKPKAHYYCNATCRNRFVSKHRKKPLGNRKTKADGRTSWNKGIANQLAADNGKKGAKKLSDTAKGRSRFYKEDGSWTWQYPKK